MPTPAPSGLTPLTTDFGASPPAGARLPSPSILVKPSKLGAAGADGPAPHLSESRVHIDIPQPASNSRTAASTAPATAPATASLAPTSAPLPVWHRGSCGAMTPPSATSPPTMTITLKPAAAARSTAPVATLVADDSLSVPRRGRAPSSVSNGTTAWPREARLCDGRAAVSDTEGASSEFDRDNASSSALSATSSSSSSRDDEDDEDAFADERTEADEDPFDVVPPGFPTTSVPQCTAVAVAATIRKLSMTPGGIPSGTSLAGPAARMIGRDRRNPVGTLAAPALHASFAEPGPPRRGSSAHHGTGAGAGATDASPRSPPSPGDATICSAGAMAAPVRYVIAGGGRQRAKSNLMHRLLHPRESLAGHGPMVIVPRPAQETAPPPPRVSVTSSAATTAAAAGPAERATIEGESADAASAAPLPLPQELAGLLAHDPSRGMKRVDNGNTITLIHYPGSRVSDHAVAGKEGPSHPHSSGNGSGSGGGSGVKKRETLWHRLLHRADDEEEDGSGSVSDYEPASTGSSSPLHRSISISFGYKQSFSSVKSAPKLGPQPLAAAPSATSTSSTGQPDAAAGGSTPLHAPSSPTDERPDGIAEHSETPARAPTRAGRPTLSRGAPSDGDGETASPRKGISRSGSEIGLAEKYGRLSETLGRGAHAVVRLAHKSACLSDAEGSAGMGMAPTSVSASGSQGFPAESGDAVASATPGSRSGTPGSNTYPAPAAHGGTPGPAGELLFAVKEFRKRRKQESSKEYVKKVIAEFCVSSSLRHLNVVETLDLIQDGRKRWCQVMEYMPGGDVYTRLSADPPLELYEVTCWFKQLMAGLTYIHGMGVAHRDLKAENLLLSRHHRILKITDFGVSEVIQNPFERTSHKVHGRCGSQPYMAPEIWQSVHRSDVYDATKVDIWAAAVVFYTLRFRSVPWRAALPDDEWYQKYLHFRQGGPHQAIMSLEGTLRHMLLSMVEVDPAKRPTAAEILALPCLAEHSCGDILLQVACRIRAPGDASRPGSPTATRPSSPTAVASTDVPKADLPHGTIAAARPACPDWHHIDERTIQWTHQHSIV